MLLWLTNDKQSSNPSPARSGLSRGSKLRMQGEEPGSSFHELKLMLKVNYDSAFGDRVRVHRQGSKLKADELRNTLGNVY